MFFCQWTSGCFRVSSEHLLSTYCVPDWRFNLKIYWVWPHPSEQDPFYPTASQEASISLSSLSIRGQTVWKPQSQKTTRLITWITTLSNSMKLWAIRCRATQDGWVMVESSDKMWSPGGRSANHFNILVLRTPWTVGKDKQMCDWRMNSPGW